LNVLSTRIAADLDAGVGARNVPESRAVQRTDPHVFDRFRLHRKIRRVAMAVATKLAAEPKIAHLTIFIQTSKSSMAISYFAIPMALEMLSPPNIHTRRPLRSNQIGAACFDKSDRDEDHPVMAILITSLRS
jgi:hypothetical protein